MWQLHGSELRRAIQDVNGDDMLSYLARNQKEVLHRVNLEKKSVMKVIQIHNEVVLIKLHILDKELILSFPQLMNPSREVSKAVTDFVDEWFDLSRDLQPFYDLAYRDEILKKVVLAYKGLRIIAVEELFEALSWSIMGQQISLHVAYGLKQKLVTTYGESIVHDNIEYWLFPTSQQIASLTVEDLRKLSFTQRKAEYIIGVAKLIATGQLNKEQLLMMSLEEMETRLTAIRGIGKWSANYVIMRCLRHTDAFPLADVGLHNALKKVLNRTEKPSLAEIEDWAKNWSGWRAYATFYLWRTLQE
ncbi:DNA-3-methyladenine glycosylase family protein [Paenisporosarcina sp.]|uniref:DNA-3-methyladenine glycosylase family protein n=1 Tax=Paenisporosarcina sp. TaxID=1932001 RepID=UPI003C72442D